MICQRPGLEYERGCRCLRCRASNAAACRRRRQLLRLGAKNIVDPAAACAHLRMLSAAGVGRKSVSAACDVSITVLQKIHQERREYIRWETEKRILAVTVEAFAGGSVIDGTETWKKINRLLDEGFTKSELARRMGLPRPELRWGRKRVTGRTAVMVDKFYSVIMAGDE